MKTEDLLNLDYRQMENKIKLVKALQIIPPLSKIDIEDLDQRYIEKALYIMCNKYGMFIKIMQDPNSGDYGYNIWCANIYKRGNLKELAKIYGICMDEILIKSAIVIYSEVRRLKKKNK